MDQHLPVFPLVFPDSEFGDHEVVELKEAEAKWQVDEEVIQLMIVFPQELSVLSLLHNILVEVGILFDSEDQLVLYIVYR